MKGISVVFYFLFIMLGAIVAFQNCSPVNFNSLPSEFSQSSLGINCLTPPPNQQEQILCPNQNGNSPLKNSINRSRTVTCENNQWAVGPWSTVNMSECGCSIPNQIPDYTTGICSCPNGQTLEQGQCLQASCDSSSKQSILDKKVCSDGVNFSSRTRTENCNKNTSTWVYGSWTSWNYNSCSCAISGQILDSNGNCQCPAGQNVIGSSCGTCPSWQTYNSNTKSCVASACNPNIKPASAESKLCSSGVGTATRSCTISCGNDFNWTSSNCTNWSFSQCQCPVGKVINAATGFCECASGTVDNGIGGCKISSCDNSTKPSSSQSTSCPSPSSGTVISSRTITCNTLSNPPSWVVPSFPAYDYSSCSCPSGQIANAQTGQCQCPTGQYMIGSSCGSCSAGYVYNAGSKSCEANCTQQEIISATRAFFSEEYTDENSVAQNCIDGALTTLDANLPTSDDKLIRFFNTCGNRFCKQISGKNYFDGRIVERGGSLQLECRKSEPPSSVSNSCRQKILSLPPAIEVKTISDTALDQLCVDSVTPVGGSIPVDNAKMIRWIFTCSTRYCKSVNPQFTSGRMIERSDVGGTIQNTINCYNEQVFNSLDTKLSVSEQPVRTFVSTMDAVATACIDSANPVLSDSYPNKSIHQSLRFVNTCGRRYCRSLGYNSGFTSEISGYPSLYGATPITLICSK